MLFLCLNFYLLTRKVFATMAIRRVIVLNKWVSIWEKFQATFQFINTI